MRQLLLTLGIVVVSLLPVQFTSAQSYPTKPIRMLVPYPAGGSFDIFARVIAQKLSAAFDKQVVVDNRGGARVSDDRRVRRSRLRTPHLVCGRRARGNPETGDRETQRRDREGGRRR